MADEPNVMATNPNGVNTPVSGAYGTNAALDRLKASLPPMPSPPPPGGQPSMPGMPNPTPVPSSLPPGPTAQPPAGLPAGLMAPTQRPGTPVSTPLDMGTPNPVGAAPDDKAKRLAILDALSRDPTVSVVTREWAGLAVRHLIAGSAQ